MKHELTTFYPLTEGELAAFEEKRKRPHGAPKGAVIALSVIAVVGLGVIIPNLSRRGGGTETSSPAAESTTVVTTTAATTTTTAIPTTTTTAAPTTTTTAAPTDEAASAEIVDSGSCGENLTWSLDNNGTLTISGEGEMGDFTV